MKKGLLWLVTASILICSLSACTKTDQKINLDGLDVEIGDTGGIKLPLDDNNTTITWLGVQESGYTGSTYIFEKLSQITGTNIEISLNPSSSNKEKIQVLMASKKLPDIIGSGLDLRLINDFAVQGALESANTYLDKLPNIKKIYFDGDEYGWVSKIYAAGDGNLYAMPNYDSSRDVNHGILYRKDIFDKHDIPMWNGPDEFYQALKKLKEIYPDSVPFTSKQKDVIYTSLATSWGTKSYNPDYIEEKGVWEHSSLSPKLKDMLDFMNKLYSEKLLDAEFLTLTEADWTGKMARGTSFVTFDWIGRLDQFTEQSKDSIPGYDLRYGNPIGPEGTIISLARPSILTAVSNGKNSELAFKLLDFMYSPAGAQLMTMGIENETFVLDENNMARYLEFDYSKPVAMNDLVDKYGMFVQGTYKRIDRRSCYFNFTEREQEAQDKGVLENRFEVLDPELLFTAEEQEKITEINMNISTAAKDAYFNYTITQGAGDAEWNAWKEKAIQLGANEMIDIYNEAQKRYDAMIK